jgi:hypothetical protein
MEAKNDQELETVRRKKLHRTLDAVGWGLFFIWIGIAFVADLGWGVGFIGFGLLILGLLAVGEILTGSADARTTKVLC